ncbi:hypothetical protein [Paenibacillus abyssi]|uniref:Uncharacterized protein n=1 Tax=Paenibacillus abyssi TaxID=1340531 RepID=A0A917G1D0_9BACL|nr:hypothetical protein [Paenibacillus abyssi]GGG18089.1 hypothetical protein GCM10010916_38620 [Paenibacillus abyssi]
MEQFGSRVNEFFQKLVGFMQETGIIFMALLALLGLLLFLISGKNLIIKRIGLMMGIIFGVGIFVFAYVPIIYYYYSIGGHAPATTEVETVFSSTTTWFTQLFRVLMIIGAPIAGTIMLLGLLVRGLGTNNPQTKRRGLGMIIVSPIILFVVYLVPNILHFL